MPCPDCVAYTGPASKYQARAGEVLWVEDRYVDTWDWIVPECGTPLCVNPDHLVVNSPTKIAYPYGICVYCGRSAGTKDHLLPSNLSGVSGRKFVATVPACGTCNSVLGDIVTTSITERRAICHLRLRKHFKKVLRTLEFTSDELDEFGHSLRSSIEHAMLQKKAVTDMLDWPVDPDYDRRALESSGVYDGLVTGFIEVETPEFLCRVRSLA